MSDADEATGLEALGFNQRPKQAWQKLCDTHDRVKGLVETVEGIRERQGRMMDRLDELESVETNGVVFDDLPWKPHPADVEGKTLLVFESDEWLTSGDVKSRLGHDASRALTDLQRALYLERRESDAPNYTYEHKLSEFGHIWRERVEIIDEGSDNEYIESDPIPRQEPWERAGTTKRYWLALTLVNEFDGEPTVSDILEGFEESYEVNGKSSEAKILRATLRELVKRGWIERPDRWPDNRNYIHWLSDKGKEVLQSGGYEFD